MPDFVLWMEIIFWLTISLDICGSRLDSGYLCILLECFDSSSCFFSWLMCLSFFCIFFLTYHFYHLSFLNLSLLSPEELEEDLDLDFFTSPRTLLERDFSIFSICDSTLSNGGQLRNEAFEMQMWKVMTWFDLSKFKVKYILILGSHRVYRSLSLRVVSKPI